MLPTVVMAGLGPAIHALLKPAFQPVPLGEARYERSMPVDAHGESARRAGMNRAIAFISRDVDSLANRPMSVDVDDRAKPGQGAVLGY